MLHVICKRTILFRDENLASDGTMKTPRTHLITVSKDPQEIPDWVGEQQAFKDATKDDTILIVELKSQRKPAPETPLQSGGKPPLDLTKLSKIELVAHAKEVHELELDPNLKKDEMVAAIQEAQDSV